MSAAATGATRPPSRGAPAKRAWNKRPFGELSRAKENQIVGKGILLWLIGVPIPVIILLWLLFR